MAPESNLGGWQNWSGGVHCNPQRIETAASEAAVAKLVREATHQGRAIRVAGAGHSFSPLCRTDGILLTLEGLTGLADVDATSHEASVWA